MTAVHHIEVHRDAQGEFRYLGYAGNNRVVDRSEEGFKNLGYAVHRARSLFPEARIRVRYTGGDGELVDYWVADE